MNKKIIGAFAMGVTALSALVAILAVLWILGTVAYYGAGSLSWKFLTQSPTEGMTGGGIFPCIVGTAILVLLMSVVGVPVGTVTAVYLSEYVDRASIVAKWVRFAVNTLAGIPSIVFGLFGLGFFVQFGGGTIDSIFEGGQLHWAQPNILWASLTMALLTLPVVIVSVEEALHNVPQELRSASLALGATRWETIWKVVLPNCTAGIMTGVILSVSRGAGEVAPILFTGVAYFLPHLPHGLDSQFMQLGYHVYVMATQSSDVEGTRGIQYATTFVLLALTFALNFSAVYLRATLRKRSIQ
jgi:phosphate transport system permease protein